MLGDKDLLGVPFGQKTSFLGQIEETSNYSIKVEFVELIEQKDTEIKNLQKTIKKLEKQIKYKNQLAKIPETSEGKNSYFKNMIEREISRNSQLKKIIYSITDRVKKLTIDIDQEISISHNSQTMQDIVMMLEGVDCSLDKSSELEHSLVNQAQENQEIDRLLDQLEISMRKVLLNYGETSKNYKQVFQAHQNQLQDTEHCRELLKKQKKTRDLLQKLLQKNETEKNQLVNQINMCINQHDLDELKTKSKQDVISFACRLNYRIKDLEQEKQLYMKEVSKEMQKELKMYQQLVAQVKSFKEHARSKHAVT